MKTIALTAVFFATVPDDSEVDLEKLTLTAPGANIINCDGQLVPNLELQYWETINTEIIPEEELGG